MLFYPYTNNISISIFTTKISRIFMFFDYIIV